MTRRQHKKGRRYAGFSGRPSEIDRINPDHGEWANESGFSRNSKGWKPDIRTLQQAHIAPVPWGPLGSAPPPNVSHDEAGYNQKMFPDEAAVGRALMYIGYRGTNGRGLLKDFQAEWNQLVQRIALDSPFQAIQWARVPVGNLVVDGNIGPRTLNALEIAVMNQQAGISWLGLLEVGKDPRQTQGRRHIYSAK